MAPRFARRHVSSAGRDRPSRPDGGSRLAGTPATSVGWLRVRAFRAIRGFACFPLCVSAISAALRLILRTSNPKKSGQAWKSQSPPIHRSPYYSFVKNML